MKHLHTLTGNQRAIALSLALFAGIVLFLLGRTLATETPALRQSLVGEGDFSSYATSITQSSYPNNFVHDRVWGSQTYTQSLGNNAPLYLLLLRVFHDITNSDIEKTVELYKVLLVASYLPGAFLFFHSILRHALTSTLITLLSTIPAGLFATGQFWGTPDVDVLPFNLFIALLPWLAWAHYQFWFLPMLDARPIKARNVWLLGAASGLFLSQVHGISGLAFAQWICALSLLFLRDMRHLGFFLMGLVLGASLRFIDLQTAGVAVDSLDEEAFATIMSIGQRYMIFPWSGKLIARLGLHHDFLVENAEGIAAFILFGHFISSVILLALERFSAQQRLWMTCLIMVQCAAVILIVDFGMLPFVILLYGLLRIWKGENDRLDAALVIALMMSLLIGPFQQMAFYYVWRITGINSMVSLIFEMARFAFIVYLPLYVLVGRSMLYFTKDAHSATVRALQMLGFGAVIFLNLHSAAGARLTLALLVVLLASTFWQTNKSPNSRVVALGAVGGALLCWGWLGTQDITSINAMAWASLAGGVVAYFLSQIQFHQRRHFVRAVGFVLVLGAISYSSFLRQESSAGIPIRQALQAPAPEQVQYDITPAYLEMTDWVSQNTAPDSLFHLLRPDRGFRYYAHRAILIAPEELTYSLYIDDLDFETNYVLSTSLYAADAELGAIAELAASHRADYIVAGPDSDFLTQVSQDEFELATRFENDEYKVIEIVRE